MKILAKALLVLIKNVSKSKINKDKQKYFTFVYVDLRCKSDYYEHIATTLKIHKQTDDFKSAIQEAKQRLLVSIKLEAPNYEKRNNCKKRNVTCSFSSRNDGYNVQYVALWLG